MKFKVYDDKGPEFPIELTISPIRTGDTTFFSAFIRDVSERVETQKVLQGSEERYRTILESIEDGYYEVDLAGNLTFYNEALSRVLGYPIEKLMGMNNRDFSDAENAKKLYQSFSQVYKTGDPMKGLIWQVARQDGSQGFIETSISLLKDETGISIGFRGIARDITARKEIEQQLAESLSSLQTTLDSTADGILSVNLEGQVLYNNQRFIEMWRYPDSVIETKDNKQLLKYVSEQLVDPEQFITKNSRPVRQY